MSNKQVTPEMIDENLVQRIFDETKTAHPVEIAEVLAWLANNPIRVSSGDQVRIAIDWYAATHPHETYAEFAVDWAQRNAFLKKEPDNPEISKLLEEFSVSREARKAIIKAYKIGKGESL